MAGIVDDVLDGAAGPVPASLGDVLLQQWMFAGEVVSCRLSLLSK
jgi:hypothetical protein